MTKQITIKLNHEHFRPLLDELRAFAGTGITESDSDLVAKSIFLAHQFTLRRRPERGNKTNFEVIIEQANLEKSDAILSFLNDYHTFKKKGLRALSGQK